MDVCLVSFVLSVVVPVVLSDVSSSVFSDVAAFIVNVVLAEPSVHTISKVCVPTDKVFRYSFLNVIIVEPAFAV